ncbi:RNA polymerase II holoenzyme cyclin-like subunit [Fusarium mundagurra]|uniref:RNA polymerase II holoenzyme cyclin-like subunit n=1 Tax=Fusarium mundagurra TaxID=1567541 RepID=A0A8H6D9S7_9HYPO|nr:RNA polymerase II holoenzyme cyclin-like subunit [Fusarium mundagurra]
MDDKIRDPGGWNDMSVVPGCGDTNILPFLHTILVNHFPLPEKDQLPRLLPEDFAMRGLLYTEDYLLNDWFRNDNIDEDEKYFELASWQQLAQSHSYVSSYPHQPPCFMAFASQNKSAEFAEFTVVPSHTAQSIKYSALTLKKYGGHCIEKRILGFNCHEDPIKIVINQVSLEQNYPDKTYSMPDISFSTQCYQPI